MNGKQGPLTLGERFLKHTIRALLGTGGHAWVYHGHDEFLDVEVAIKILHRPGGVTNDMLRRGQSEAKLLYRLKHENIVSVLDAGITDDGLLYIVMELLQGETLRRVLLKRGNLALSDALELFAKIADGVEAAHAFGAIHRDLKPENIFVLPGAHPKVLDFGIAKVVDAAGWTTEKDVIHGTVLYMSPEQLRGEKATAASDVYALGLMLFEVLHGRHPLLLKNRSPTIKELTWMQLTMKPPPLDELDDTIPRYVARLVERMILKVPAHRPSSMQECAETLRACLRRLANTPSPCDDDLDMAEQFVTDKLHDTERTEGLPFDASITLPLVPVAPRPPRGTEPVESARAARPLAVATVRPVTAPVPGTAPHRNTRGFDDAQRRRMLKVFAASCVVGATFGGLYVALAHRSATSPSSAGPAELEVRSVAVPAVEAAPVPQVNAVPAPLPLVPAAPAAAIASNAAHGAAAPASLDAGAAPRIVVRQRPKRHESAAKDENHAARGAGSSTAGSKSVEQHRLADADFPILE